MDRRHTTILSKALVFTALAAFALPAVAAENATFDKTFTVTSPVRIELSSGSGSVEIRGSADGRVHVHGKVFAGRLVALWRWREECGGGGSKSSTGAERKHNSHRKEFLVDEECFD